MSYRLAMCVCLVGCTPAAAVAPAPAFVFELKSWLTATGRFVQATPPSECAGYTQPTIVDFETRGADRVAVWSCLPACKPRKEYVTLVERGPSAPGASTKLSASCFQRCPASSHRRSYMDFGSPHCDPGPPPVAEAAALMEEQRRVGSIHDRDEDAAFREVESRLSAVESRARPWDEATATEFFATKNQAFAVERNWDDETRVRAMKDRVDALYPLSRPAAELSKHRKLAAAQLFRCNASCDSDSRSCTAACADMPRGACDTCATVLAQCQAACRDGAKQ